MSRLAAILLLIVLLVVGIMANLMLGSVHVDADQVWSILTGGMAEKKSWGIIVLDVRLPKVITAIAAGAALSVAGLQMQTLFRNPLAGPFVLGISSGASLGVGLLVMAGGLISWEFFASNSMEGSWAMVISAMLGSLLVLLLVMAVSIRVKDSVTLLIVGLMFGSFAGALISVMQFFSTPELIESFIIWTFGSLGGVTWTQLIVMGPLVATGLILALVLQKNYNALLLGEQYAKSLGVSTDRTRILTIVSTSLLAGSITAFCGPIAFIGLAVPHLCRSLFNTADHRTLLPVSMLMGAVVMLGCNLLAELPGSELHLPLNAVTALLGAPIVLWIILQRQNLGKNL